jgi:hypothetical protein
MGAASRRLAGEAFQLSMRRRATSRFIFRAASGIESCSQIRMTAQPLASRAALSRRSRATLRRNFSSQKSALDWGDDACSGHRCQKQPSRKTATRSRVKTTSGRTFLSPALIRKSFRNRRPSRCSSFRRDRSGRVSDRRLACMERRTAGLVAEGASTALRLHRLRGQRPVSVSRFKRSRRRSARSWRLTRNWLH